MTPQPQQALEVLILAIEETAGSALYGMVDVLMAAGNIWQTLVETEAPGHLFNVRIVSLDTQPFECGHAIPVKPACSIADKLRADILILPEIWLGPHESIHGRYPALMDWIRQQYKQGTNIFSACSGSVLLAESGLLNRCEATSHWGYQSLFQEYYPEVHFRPEANLVFADPAGHIITAGGTTSWHDLALHIIARFAGTGEALHIAKVYLLKWHAEGQLPFTPLVRRTPHADAIVRRCEDWLKDHYHEAHIISDLVEQTDIPERSLKRRFKTATGSSLMEFIQNLRIEEAKRLLETTGLSIEAIGWEISYEDTSFFRRLFKRLTGLTPGQYRRMFQAIQINADD